MYAGPQHNALAFGSNFCVLWRKGLSFSPGLGKVCRCLLDNSCYLLHLGSRSAPTCPGPSCPLSSILDISGTAALYRWSTWASEKSLRGWERLPKGYRSEQLSLGSSGGVHNVGLRGSDEPAAMGREQPLVQTQRRQTGRRKVHNTMVRDPMEGCAKCPDNSSSRGLEMTFGLCFKG